MDVSNKLYDKSFRTKLRAEPQATIAQWGKELGYTSGKEVEIKVVTNTKTTTYVVLSSMVTAKDLDNMQVAGNCAGSVSSVGSASTFGCATTSISTVGTGGSVGSAGSANFCNG